MKKETKFKKGISGNLNGRPKGVPNKTTLQTREYFSELVKNNLDKLQEDIDSLEPKDRIKAILDLATFVLPKLNAIDITTGGEQLERFVTIRLENE